VTAGVGVHHPARQVGLTARWDYANSTSDRLEVKHSGFMLQAILYNGPGRFFRFKVRYHLDVKVRHQAGRLVVGRADVLRRKLFSRRAAGADRIAFADPPPLAETIAGEATFVIVEKLAPTTPIPGADEAARIGRVRVPVSLRPHTARVHNRPRRVRVPEPPDIEAHLTGQRTTLNADDQVTGTKGSAGLAAELESALADLGIDRNAYGHLPAALTSKETLAATQVRGPSVHQHSFVSTA